MLLWLIATLIADTIITTTILYGLLMVRTGWAHTDKVITRLVRLTFESQLPPSIIALVFLVEFRAYRLGVGPKPASIHTALLATTPSLEWEDAQTTYR